MPSSAIEHSFSHPLAAFQRSTFLGSRLCHTDGAEVSYLLDTRASLTVAAG
jgi:hypothetical protein